MQETGYIVRNQTPIPGTQNDVILLIIIILPSQPYLLFNFTIAKNLTFEFILWNEHLTEGSFTGLLNIYLIELRNGVFNVRFILPNINNWMGIFDR